MSQISEEHIASRLFLSVDIAGSTGLKHEYDIAKLGKEVKKNKEFLERFLANREDTAILIQDELYEQCIINTFGFSGESSDWIAILKNQFEDFDGDFKGALRTKGMTYTPGDHIWKCLGDEILYCFPITSEPQALAICKSFLSTLHNYDKKALSKHFSSQHSKILRMKGAAWLANFPLRNRCTELFGKDDYFGLDMDIGFRIAKFALPGTVCVNFDLAYLFSKHLPSEAASTFKGGIVGWEELKGVWDGIRYPVIWLVDDAYTGYDLEQGFPDWANKDAKISALKQIISDETHCRLTATETQLEYTFNALQESLHLPRPCILNTDNRPQEIVDSVALLQRICQCQRGAQEPESEADASSEALQGIALLQQKLGT